MIAYYIAQMSHVVRMCSYNNIQMSLVVKCVRLLASVQKSISLQRSKNESLSIKPGFLIETSANFLINSSVKSRSEFDRPLKIARP